MLVKTKMKLIFIQISALLHIFTMQIDCTEVLNFCKSSLKHPPYDIDSWALASNFGLKQRSASFPRH
jgi:hypothetical protein